MNFFFSSRRRHTFFFQAEDGIRDRSPSRGLGDVYKRQTQFRELFQGEVLTGDGSRGGPDRRELTAQELDTFDTALKAASSRPSKI